MIHSYFYPRSPCGERLAEVDGEDTSSGDFYPRSPCGERLLRLAIFRELKMISIHALLAESDSVRYDARLKAAEFLSTLSLRRATSKKYRVYYLTLISIHALLAESDCPGT